MPKGSSKATDAAEERLKGGDADRCGGLRLPALPGEQLAVVSTHGAAPVARSAASRRSAAFSAYQIPSCSAQIKADLSDRSAVEKALKEAGVASVSKWLPSNAALPLQQH